ncbi:putative apoptosis-inducing factor [Aspergillus venezuelensis]
MPPKHVVIVGGSMAGLATAHQILKQTSTNQVRVTIVSRDSHLYWNIASPRAVASASKVPDSDLFVSIPEGFAKYPEGQFEFILGTATGIDVTTKVLRVGGEGKGADEMEKQIGYDVLILCTGSDTKTATPFKSRGSTEATKRALHEYQKRIKAARTVLVIGAGPTGVEVAGELASEYKGEKKIILASSTSRVLSGPNRPASVSRVAESQLRTLNVDLRLNTKVEDEKELADGTWEITLSEGRKLVVDMYIPTFGVTPNSSFIPSEFLNREGFVILDEHMRVKGTKDIYAVGDVSDIEGPQAFYVNGQSKYVAKSVVLGATGKSSSVVPYKKSNTSMIGVQIGQKGGTGHMGSIRFPSFMIAYLRKTLLVEQAPKLIDGSAF